MRCPFELQHTAGVFMGLAERKDKQRIGRDPRNLAWARDTTSFGQRMLMRQGWTPGTGLGATSSGSPDALARPVSASMSSTSRLGLGADAKVSAEESYQQMAAFQSVLARLNATAVPSGAHSDASSSSDTSSSSSDSSSESDSVSAEALSIENDQSDSSVKDDNAAKRRRVSSSESEEERVTRRPVARLAHRQKFIRNKAVSSYSAEQLREIFG